MRRELEYKYLTNGRPWSAELLVMFALGFALASLLWAGWWLFHSRPAQAAAQEQRETALESCTAELKLGQQAEEKSRAEKEFLDRALEEARRQLQQARVGWGRCLKGQEGAESGAQP